MRESRKSSARIGIAAAGLVACLTATSLAAPAYAADKGGESRGGFAGILRMFNIFSSHHDEKPAAKKAAPVVTTDSGVKVTASSSADGSAKMGVEIPLDDPASVAKGEGAFVYLETGSDVVDAADLSSHLPKASGHAVPGSAAQSLATRAAAFGGTPVHGMSLAGAGVDGLQTGSMWSFTPRYAGIHFGVSFLSEGTPGVDHKGFEFGVSSSFLRNDVSNGLKGAFLNAPLLGSNRRISNIGFHLGYAGFTFGASLQRDRTDLVGIQSAYDVGVRYRRGAFSTSLQFSSSSNQTSKGLLFRVNPDNRTYAFEFGAAYHLRPGISLGGGLQYFNYNSVSLVPENDDAAVVFLGGNVNF